MVWSAEMHQQFVEAVERLGVDSAPHPTLPYPTPPPACLAVIGPDVACVKLPLAVECGSCCRTQLLIELSQRSGKPWYRVLSICWLCCYVEHLLCI